MSAAGPAKAPVAAAGPPGALRRAGLAVAREVAHRGLLVPVIRSLVRLRVSGAHHVRDTRGPVIVVANHSSHLDAPALFAGLPRRTTRHLATAAAADYFFASRIKAWPTLLFFNAIPVHRDGDRSRSGLARAAVTAGTSLLVFPEGGRARTDVHRPFKPGAAALAISCGVPCLPVAVVGARQAMPRGARWPVRGRPVVELVIGAPTRPRPDEGAEAFAARLALTVGALSRSTDRPLIMTTGAADGPDDADPIDVDPIDAPLDDPADHPDDTDGDQPWTPTDSTASKPSIDRTQRTPGTARPPGWRRAG